MTEKEWAFVDELRRYMNQLECDLLRQRCRLTGFNLETMGDSIRLVIDFTPGVENTAWDIAMINRCLVERRGRPPTEELEEEGGTNV